jgi:predicted aspartyl protease
MRQTQSRKSVLSAILSFDVPRGARVAVVILATLAIAGGTGCQDPRVVGSSAAPPDSAAGEITFRWAGPGGAAIVVPVRINGRDPVDLILDTGATLTCVDTALARDFALPERRAVVGAAVGVGGAGRVRLHSVDSLHIGAAVARELTVCAIDLQGLRAVSADVRGLLGLNVLRHFDVTLDFDRSVLRLATPAGRRGTE